MKSKTYILNIRKFMQEKNIKTNKLAAYLDVSSNTITNWMHERNPMPVDALIKICDFMNIPYCSVFDGVVPENYKQVDDNKIQELEHKIDELKDKIISLQDKLIESTMSFYTEKNILNEQKEKYK